MPISHDTEIIVLTGSSPTDFHRKGVEYGKQGTRQRQGQGEEEAEEG
jgi:hypothetical protein